MSAAAPDNLAELKAFGADWLEPLGAVADVRFEYASFEECFDAPSVIADRFVAQFGFKQIGFNWEMLDASADASGARAALTVMSEAFEREMVQRQQWLGAERAGACANAFINAFEPAQRTILSNRFDGLWNPISDATFEWAFVGFDSRKIALLLVMADG